MLPITEVAAKLGIDADDMEHYGKYKAKLTCAIDESKSGKLILVTAINPTPAGEGKTTTTIGLGDALSRIGKKTALALREPSLGPVMGIKGGAAGGGYAQVVPMEDINLHFTGDMHAITAANNLLSAMLDNHIKQGNELNIDINNITHKRCMDMNDRSLRQTVIGLGGSVNGIPRQDGFIITVASEVMAILCLAADMQDLKARLSRMIVAYDMSGKAITAADLQAVGAMALLLKDAIKPNLVQTLEGTPCVMHGGPFANIAHGCNSITATKLALAHADYVVTEAGFGADLGAEKFFDIVCRYGELTPSCTVLVATIRALKYNGGVKKENLGTEDLQALQRGIVNLDAHIDNLRGFGIPVIVNLNIFASDTAAEREYMRNYCQSKGIPFAENECFAKGGEGAVALAEQVVAACDAPSDFKYVYALDATIAEKIDKLASTIYGCQTTYTPKALKQIDKINSLGYGNLPICVAKTQYSLTDNPSLLGRPRGHTITIREVEISAGAGFIVVMAGDIIRMPGLPKKPSAQNIDIHDDGIIVGLF